MNNIFSEFIVISCSNVFTFNFTYFLCTAFNLSMSNLFTSVFKLTKSDFAASSDVSIPVASFKPVLVA